MRELRCTNAPSVVSEFQVKPLLLFLVAMVLFTAAQPADAQTNFNKGVWCWACIEGTTIDPRVLNNSNIRGFSYYVPWSQLEPADGVFNWSSITALEAQLKAGQYLAVYPLMGVNAPSWLQAETDSYIWPFGYQFPICSIQSYPLFMDPVYQAKWEAFVAGFNTQFHNDPMIARTDIPPFSTIGFDTETSFPCAPGTSTCNSAGQMIINGSPPTGCIGTDSINQWRNDSDCGTNQTCFTNLVTSVYDSLFSYEYSQFEGATFQIAGWFSPQRFPNLAWTGSGSDSSAYIIDPLLIDNAYATAGSDFMVGNEALGPNNGFTGFMAPFCDAGIPCIAQEVMNLTSSPQNCPTLVAADNTGISTGVKLIEIYETDILNCPSEISRVKSILDP